MDAIDLVSTATQYGLLGALTLLLGYFAWNTYKRLERKNEELEIKVDKLQEEMVCLLTEERDRMAELVKKNTEAIQELSKVILQYIIKETK